MFHPAKRSRCRYIAMALDYASRTPFVLLDAESGWNLTPGCLPFLGSVVSEGQSSRLIGTLPRWKVQVPFSSRDTCCPPAGPCPSGFDIWKEGRPTGKSSVQVAQGVHQAGHSFVHSLIRITADVIQGSKVSERCPRPRMPEDEKLQGPRKATYRRGFPSEIPFQESLSCYFWARGPIPGVRVIADTWRWVDIIVGIRFDFLYVFIFVLSSPFCGSSFFKFF